MFYCAERDLMNPQIELYATVGSSESNPNETVATATAFLLSFGIALIIFLLLTEGGTSTQGVYIKYALVAFGALLYRIHIFSQKLRLYYKEK
jgi:amino acid transporter